MEIAIDSKNGNRARNFFYDEDDEEMDMILKQNNPRKRTKSTSSTGGTLPVPNIPQTFHPLSSSSQIHVPQLPGPMFIDNHRYMMIGHSSQQQSNMVIGHSSQQQSNMVIDIEDGTHHTTTGVAVCGEGGRIICPQDDDINSVKLIPPPTPVKTPARFMSRHLTEGRNCECLKPARDMFEEHADVSDSDVASESDISDSYFDLLSNELVLSVFRWLPKSTLARCARTCRRWNMLAFDESLWRRLDLQRRTLQPGVAGRILCRGTQVLRLARADVKEGIYDGKDIDRIKQSMGTCVKLQYLDLSMAHIDTHSLTELLTPCAQLRKVSLESCPLNDSVLRCLSRCSQLEVLNLSMCTGITQEPLVNMLHNCKRLVAVNLAWTGLTHETIQEIVKHLPQNVVKLNLSGCRMGITDEDISTLFLNCPMIRELDLSDCTAITINTIDCILHSLPNITYIALSRCYNIPQFSFTELKSLPSLAALDIFGLMLESDIKNLRVSLPGIFINRFPFSSIARPTTNGRKSTLWGLKLDTWSNSSRK